MRAIVSVFDPVVWRTFGGDLPALGSNVVRKKRRGKVISRDRTRRCYLKRIDVAIAKGWLPTPVYTSARSFGFDSQELEASLSRLPRRRVRQVA